jgi:uncharacterized protein YjaZ
MSEFPYNGSIDNVLNNILYEGKVMYAVRKLLSETPDSLLFGYTSEQFQWCQNNTDIMWTTLIENKLLFSTDELTISKLINPAPFSFSTREAPGRASIWLGYRIIASYMKRHKGVTLEKLLLDSDYQKILNEAKFKP